MRHTKSLALVLTLAAGSLHADEITLKSNEKILGVIVNESGFGISVEGRQKIVPAADIVDIRFDKKVNDQSGEFYFPARVKDKDAFEKSKGRKENLLDAIRLYEKTLDRMPKDADQAAARRQVEFRIAYLRSRLTQEYKESPNLAMSTLKAFKDKHPNCWQISHCLRALASLQASQGKYADAEKTYAELSLAPVADDVKQEAEFLSAQLGMQAGNFEQASARLQALGAKLPKDSPVIPRVLVTQAECLAMAKKTDEAGKLLRQMLKDAPDKNLKALAHNALGKILYDQGLLKEARWEFLWVDVIYNQDRAEHAKALYYLWHTFGKIGEVERAAECRDTLLSEQFNGTDYQRRALIESKK